MAAHVESTFLGEIVGCCEECLTTASITGEPGGWSRVVPTQVLVGRAVAALCAAEAMSCADATVRAVGRVKRQAQAVLGEPLVARGRVRARSRWRPDLCYLTLDVSIRRAQGGEVLSFELALELRPAAVDAA